MSTIKYSEYLHNDAREGNTDRFEFLAAQRPHSHELLLKTDSKSRTALHYAADRRLAQLMVESIKPSSHQYFILSVDINQQTALHTAANDGRSDVIEFLLSFPSARVSLLWTQDLYGRTALHYSKDRHTAQVLIESIEVHKVQDYILVVDTNMQTSFHIAAEAGRVEVARYLLQSMLPSINSLLKPDGKERTPFHYPIDVDIAKTIVEHVSLDEIREVMLAVDEDQRTALHMAARYGRSDLLAYLCTLFQTTDEWMLRTDYNDKTALHLAENTLVVQLLVESISPDLRREFIRASDEDGQTALHSAVEAGRTDVAEYLLSISSDDSLLLQRDECGGTALHYASKKSIAEILIESVASSKRRDFLFTVDETLRTALHTAAESGHDDVVGYLCALTNCEELIFQKDEDGRTALHYAQNKRVAEVLVEGVYPCKRRDFLLLCDSSRQTAVHRAAILGRNEVLLYLLGTLLDVHPLDKFWLMQDKLGMTALHLARNKIAAKLLVGSAHADVKEFLLAVDANQQTALHSSAEDGKTDIVEYLASLSQDDSLFFLTDNHGRTALHISSNREIAQLLIESISPAERRNFISLGDECQMTALHLAVKKDRADVVEYLSSLHSKVDDELLLMRNSSGRTALHYAKTATTANCLLEAAKSGLDYLRVEDLHHYTALMAAFKYGRYDVGNAILAYVESNSSDHDLNSTMCKKNIDDQNIFHLATLSPMIKSFIPVLSRYLPIVDIEYLMVADEYGNTPLTYTASRYSTKLFAEIITRMSLEERRHILPLTNRGGQDCYSIASRTQFSEEYFLESVLCDERAVKRGYFNTFKDRINPISMLLDHESYHTNNGEILKVMKYALNEYSPLDFEFTIQHPGTPESICSPRWLCVSLDELKTPQIAQLQERINLMDAPENHGKPKVVVIQACYESLCFVPPGPDFILITVCTNTAKTLNFTEKISGGIESFIQCLNDDEEVKYVDINSTLGRRYVIGRPEVKDIDDQTQCNRELTVCGVEQRGRALVICNRRTRPGWEEELGLARTLLGEQLGLEVTTEFDISSDNVTAKIREFSKSLDHVSAVALVIMSHGDLDGNMTGDDGTSSFSAQTAIDALCTDELNGIPKIVLLSFCRGSIGHSRVNRTANSWECVTLPGLIDSLFFSPVRRALTPHDRELEWEVRAFPSVRVPENCYVCFSTLPDSKSLRGEMFESFSLHLADIYATSDRFHQVKGESALVDDSLSKPPSTPRVGLVALLTDVAGVMRERSRFTQYMNHCYRVTKNTVDVVLDVFPIASSKAISKHQMPAVYGTSGYCTKSCTGA